MRRQMTAAVLAGLLFATGCANLQQYNPSKVRQEEIRRQTTVLISKNQFQEARELLTVVKTREGLPADPAQDEQNPFQRGFLGGGQFASAWGAGTSGGTSQEDKYKEHILETVVNPAEAKFTADRILRMIAQVEENLKKGDDEAARQVIYTFGITGQKAVDTVVYISKCHYLNKRVNPVTLNKWERFAKRNVDASIEAGDFMRAFAAARRIATVGAYPVRIDELLEASGDAAVEQHTDKEGTGFVVGLAKAYLYGAIARRDGDEKDPLSDTARALRERTETMIPPEKFVPDWTAVENRLQQFKQALLEDDVDEDDADELVKVLLQAYKDLVDDDRGLTTFELNTRLSKLRQDSLHRVAQALEEAIRKAEAELAAALRAAEAERAAALRAAEAARLEELRKLWLALASAMAEEVDSMEREREMLAAISDRAEPGINRILGEGCRVLRWYRTTGRLSKEDATSLFVAAVYMGFDDLMDLARAFGTDINGTSEKDCLGRTAYLLALQYGFKGQAEEMLASADATRRDAKGYGAVHYAVRGGDAKVLLSLLKNGLDAKSPADDGTTPLMLAVARGNGPMVRMLLGGSDIDAADSNGWTALHFAADRGELDIVQALVGVHASTDKKTNEGDTVLSLGVKSNSEELLAYLLDDLKLPADERAVSRCVIEGWLWPLKMLVEHGGELTDRHLAAAVACKQFAVVKWLVGRGFDVNADAVHDVVTNDSGEIWDYLRSQGYRVCGD